MSFKKVDRRESLGLIALAAKPEDELEEDTMDDEDLSCGIGNFRPAWLQRFNTPKSFLVNNAAIGLLNGATWAYFVGCVSTLEKRYAFESQISGIILTSEEIVPLLFGFLTGYFGSRTHRPRFIACAMLLSCLSSFTLASPFFIYGPLKDSSALDHYSNQTDLELCDMTKKDYVCNTNPTLLPVSMFFIGLVMKGFGSTAFYIVGTPFLDDNIKKKKNTPLYFAALMVIAMLGPVFGFLLSSLCLQFYEDPFFDPGFGPDDPRWIGAWWAGFILIGILMFLFSIPLWFYPRRFPGSKPPKALEQKGNGESKSVMDHLREMKNIFKRMYTNKIFICHQLGSIMKINGIEGYFILMPKYVEMQFKQTASKANLLSGPAVIGVMQIGIILGGVAINRFRPRPRILTGSIAVSQVLMVLSLIICMYITCASYQTSETGSSAIIQVNLDNDCNSICQCTTKEYTPICGPDGISTYFSPCYAGCTEYNKTNDKKVYTNCKCVHDEEGTIATEDAVDGYCGFECKGLIVYIITLCLGKFMFALIGVADTLVTLRCVNPEDKSVALGAVSFLYSFLAFIPYPLLYGALTDSSCLVWEQSCGKTGNCWIYDTDRLRYVLHGASAIFLSIGCVFDIIVCILSKRLQNLYDDNVESPDGNTFGDSQLLPTKVEHELKQIKNGDKESEEKCGVGSEQSPINVSAIEENNS